MFELLSTFVNDITEYKFQIPLWLQITLIIIILSILLIGAYFAYDIFNISYMRNGYIWFIFVAIINLVSILALLIYYNNKNSVKKYVGKRGRKGKKGKMGKKGTSVSCNYCKNNVYLQRVRRADVIATLNSYTEDFKTINDNINYFNNIIAKGNINYDSFVNGIILGKNIDTSQTESIDKFRSLMTVNSIAIFLIKNINKNITKASTRTYGTFRNPFGKVGYTSIGDSVYGGSETFELNSFMVNGDYMHPSSYKLLVTLTSYNEKTGDIDTYSIWRPESQTIIETGFKGEKNKVSYEGLGDLCRFGTSPPKLNDMAILSEKCLEPVSYKDLTLVFVYVGSLNFNDKNNKIDYTQPDSYLIENKVANNIEIFSVWRTPLNTFLTNCNSQNELINGTISNNMVNDISDAFNEYGAVSFEAKKHISNILQSISIPKILIATIICKHYELEIHKELIYYFNRYQSSIPEFAKVIKNAEISSSNYLSLGQLMNAIKATKQSYENFNKNLIKKAKIDLSKKSGSTYDPRLEKYLPAPLLKAYNSANTQLLTISVLIENTNTFLDIVNILFDNGIDTRIAIDSDGIAEGGYLLNEIQETVIRICKMLMPPTYQAYIIKDECLGTFALDRDREEVIRKFTEIKEEYNKIIDEFTEDNAKYENVLINVRQNEDLMINKIGQLCGHITNYMTKINNMNLEEFTTSRIKGLQRIYEDMVAYLKNVANSV